MPKTFESLFAELSAKVESADAASKTVAEVEAGVHFIGKKLVEEAAETWMAAEHESDEAFCEEASQLLYHLQCMLLAKGKKLEDLYEYL